MIRHVLNVTGQDSIQYVGLSMGTTGFMVAANEHPEFMEKSVKGPYLIDVYTGRGEGVSQMQTFCGCCVIVVL